MQDKQHNEVVLTDKRQGNEVLRLLQKIRAENAGAWDDANLAIDIIIGKERGF